jgi:hypothetical protein
MTVQDDVIERTSVVTYSLLQELHEVLCDPRKPDEISLGIIMGLAMFLDDKIGPFRTKKLLDQAPTIILKTDAHVTDELRNRFLPVLHAFGGHLNELRPAARPEPACNKVI